MALIFQNSAFYIFTMEGMPPLEPTVVAERLTVSDPIKKVAKKV